MKHKLLLIAALLLGNIALFAQNNSKITGEVKDGVGKPLSGINLLLNRAKDSVFVKAAVSDKEGTYNFVNIKPGDYYIVTSSIGFQKNTSPAFSLVEGETKTIGTLTLAIASKNLQGVVVESKKPMIEVKADKMIVNVEGTINAVGNDALELLRKSPGVTIDKDDNLSLAGKNGVQVYIDGKPSPLSGADLANYLKSMQSAQIEAIEIITNPSAKYEAAGNAGIINIKLKKNKAFGTNGSVNAGYVQGTYAKFNGGINLNHRNKKINIFGNYNYNNGLNLMQFNSNRTQADTLFSQSNRITFKNNSHSFKTGLDYFVNTKNTLGVVISGNISDNDINTAGPMRFTHIPTNQLVKILNATNTNDMQRDNVNTNLNYRYAVTGGKELNIDADYGIFKIRSNQYQPNFNYLPNGVTEIGRSIYNMLSPTNINLFSLKTDYEQNYKGGKLGIGGKIGIVNTDNDFKRYNVFTSGKTLDTLKSNLFKYKENINAIYANYNKQLKKGIMVQMGLRVENTNATGNSVGTQLNAGIYTPFDSTFKRNYTDFFPSASVTFNKNPMKQWTISYSRRIDRPAYQDLNPFEFKLNEYTFMKGNTLLRPQYTNSFSVTNIYKYRLTTTVNYSHVKDIFAQVPDSTEKSKSLLIKKNLATQDIVSLNISYPYQYKWYSAFVTTNTNYSHYKANLLDESGKERKVDQKVLSFTFYMQNSFKLGKGVTAELSGLYISPSVWQGMFRSGAMGLVDIGLSKNLFKGKASVKAVVSDVFQTMKWSGSADFAGSKSTVNGNGEMPQFKLNFNYRFGNSQVKSARQRKSAIEDENKRTQSSGGGIGGQ